MCDITLLYILFKNFPESYQQQHFIENLVCLMLYFFKSVLTCLFCLLPSKISDGAAEDIRSLVKERYTTFHKK
jgi:hypothetical protein